MSLALDFQAGQPPPDGLEGTTKPLPVAEVLSAGQVEIPAKREVRYGVSMPAFRFDAQLDLVSTAVAIPVKAPT